MIFLYRFGVFGSSKGKKPHTIAYRITPLLHMSVLRGVYDFPAIISGAAYQGLPQAVFN